MALEMRAAPRPVSARRPTPDGGAGPVGDGSGWRLTGPVGGQRSGPIPAQIGPKMADLVPHTGIARRVRRAPTEQDAPVEPGHF
jgi:hypothetical protein